MCCGNRRRYDDDFAEPFSDGNRIREIRSECGRRGRGFDFDDDFDDRSGCGCTSTVRIDVRRDFSNTFLANMTVVLTNIRTGRRFVSMTNCAGTAFFDNIPYGEYRVSCGNERGRSEFLRCCTPFVSRTIFCRGCGCGCNGGF